MTDEWFYKRGDSTFGPVGGAMLHDLIRRGRLGDDTAVRRDGTEEWVTVGEARPSLPPPPETTPQRTPSETQPRAEAPSFDSTSPAASVIYAPPQSFLLSTPGALHPPFHLRLGITLVIVFTVPNIVMWTLTSTAYLWTLLSGEPLPGWLMRVAALVFPEEGPNYLLLGLVGQTLAIIIWQGCAFTSLKHLYGDGMVRRSAASGLWWIVPIATMFMPLFCLRDLRYLSRKRRDFPHSHPSFGPLLVWFEILLLIDIPLNVASAILRLRMARSREFEPEQEPSSIQSLLEQASDFQSILFSLVVLTIVISNFRQQKELFRYWKDDNHWKGR